MSPVDGILFESFFFLFGLKESRCTLNLVKSVKLLFYAAAMNLIAYFSTINSAFVEHCSGISRGRTACIFPTEIMKSANMLRVRFARCVW